MDIPPPSAPSSLDRRRYTGNTPPPHSSKFGPILVITPTVWFEVILTPRRGATAPPPAGGGRRRFPSRRFSSQRPDASAIAGDRAEAARSERTFPGESSAWRFAPRLPVRLEDAPTRWRARNPKNPFLRASGRHTHVNGQEHAWVGARLMNGLVMRPG